MSGWQTETGRKALLHSFIEGFRACRRGIVVTPGSYGFHVAFHEAIGRSGEYFACEPFPADLLTKLKPDEWLTTLGDFDELVPRGHSSLKVLVDELFMLADIADLEKSTETLDDCLISDAAQIAAFNASGQIYPFEPNDRSFLFAVVVDGSVAATARYGVADPGDIVVDRVSTAPAFRRRGFARQVMTALAEHAAREGHRRALLISSQQGEPLYRGLGYQPVAPARVFIPA